MVRFFWGGAWVRFRRSVRRSWWGLGVEIRVGGLGTRIIAGLMVMGRGFVSSGRFFVDS